MLFCYWKLGHQFCFAVKNGAKITIKTFESATIFCHTFYPQKRDAIGIQYNGATFPDVQCCQLRVGAWCGQCPVCPSYLQITLRFVSRLILPASTFSLSDILFALPAPAATPTRALQFWHYYGNGRIRYGLATLNWVTCLYIKSSSTGSLYILKTPCKNISKQTSIPNSNRNRYHVSSDSNRCLNWRTLASIFSDIERW